MYLLQILLIKFACITLSCLKLSQTLVDIILGIPKTNVASLIFALVSCVVLIVVKELGARFRHKIPFPIPVEIIVVSNEYNIFSM